MPTALEQLKAKLYDVNALGAAIAIMDWDQQTYLPKNSSDARANHVSLLSRMAHEAFVSEETQKALEGATKEVQPGTEDADFVRVTQRNMDLRTKLPAEYVARRSKLTAEAHDLWVEARANNNFVKFAPIMEQMFDLAREEATLIGYKDEMYDALIDQSEEGATHAQCVAIFDSIRQPMVELIRDIKNSPSQPDDSFLHGDWPTNDQREFTEFLLKSIGFDMDRGRIDTAAHPFCTGWSVNDIRLTTRFKPYLMSAIYGTLHEAGHGMYEQGSPEKWDRTPLAGGVSLGIHESQSRTWENIVGRSNAFVSWMLPHAVAKFPQLAGRDVKSVYRAINKVEPSFIRVEADEVTYNMHIMIRFECENAILKGELKIADLPAFWNSKYEEYLGITPANDAEGCLQDVHWSAGLIGYFPTYTFGNLLSYQFWTCLENDLGDTNPMMESGNFAPILGWLKDKIYSKGQSIPPQELVKQVTGKPIGAEDYLAGINKRYREIYDI